MASQPLHPASEPTPAERLRADGYVILRDLIGGEAVGRLRHDLATRFAETPFCEGDFFGRRTKRFHGLLTRLRDGADLVMHRAVMPLIEQVLLPHADTIQLNLTQAIEIHPGEIQQIPHRDDGMWPIAERSHETLVHVIWPATPFTRETGATLVWPGSHGATRTPLLPPEQAIAAEMDPGDALVMLGSTLHGGGANRSARPRTGAVISYCLGWLKPYENMWLTYPPAIARRFDPALAALVGYRQHRPNLGGYDGRCPSILLAEGDHDHLAAIDNMPPEQAELLRRYVAAQEHNRGDAIGSADID